MDFKPNLQLLSDSDPVPWHQHNGAYAAIILDGGYEEAGDEGRYQVTAGDVIVHPPFSAHIDRVNVKGATVVNVPLSARAALSLSSGRVADNEQMLWDIRSNAGDVATILTAAILPAAPKNDLPDALAAAISRDPSMSLGLYADASGASERTLRRQFALTYGITSKHFRARAKAKRAWEQITYMNKALVDIALDVGFADQAHMSRAIRWLTGYSPKQWRLADTSKTRRVDLA
ncbi:MAG: helix-turn-helix transcriptional regulator [Sphingomonas sp.]